MMSVQFESPKPGVRCQANGLGPLIPYSRTMSRATVASLPCTCMILPTHLRSCGMGSMSSTIWWQGSHSRPRLAAGTASNMSSHAVGLCAMFQSPVFQLPPIEQFSKARRTSLSPARFASSPKTFLNAGIDSGIGLPVRRPVKPATRSAPNRWALSISRSQLASVSALLPSPVSGFPKMLRHEMMTSCSASRSVTLRPSSGMSAVPVVCQNVSPNDSNP